MISVTSAASTTVTSPPLPTTLDEAASAIINAVAVVAQAYDLMVGPVKVGDYPDGCDWFALHPVNARADYPVKQHPILSTNQRPIPSTFSFF